MKTVLEALLFVNEKPIEIKELAAVLGVDRKDVENDLKELSQSYIERDSGICIVKVAGGYQMCSRPENEEWIRKMYREKNKHRLSSAALETLAIIAYKQPITRLEVEMIRGVNADGVVRHLLSLSLIKEAGRKEVPGRPFLYITTRKFLEHFGLDTIKDLPGLEEFPEFSSEIQEGNAGKDAASEECAPAEKCAVETEFSGETSFSQGDENRNSLAGQKLGIEGEEKGEEVS